MLSKVLECEANTSNVAKYLELGVEPVRFEIMKKKILFLQYILKQEKNSMVFQVFQATCDNPINNDFVKICKKYLDILEINLSFKEIEEMSNWTFKKLVKEQTKKAAFKYLMEKKNQPNKQTKISQIFYDKLESQSYLIGGNKNSKISKIIFQARTKTIDLKAYKSWKYDDDLCVGCNERTETIDEILSCDTYSEKNKQNRIAKYDWLFGISDSDKHEVGLMLLKRLRKREKLLEAVT